MSGMEAVALTALIGGTALSATGQVMSGQEKAAASDFEAAQYRVQEQRMRTAAAEDEAARRRELTSNLETIAAIRAGRGVGSASPTGMAIFDDILSRGEDEIGISRTNYLLKAEQGRQAALMSERRARSSLLAGYLGAAESVASAGFKYATFDLNRVKK